MSCPQIPQLTRGEFAQELIKKWTDERVPLSGSMELDLRCNLRCHHCYRDGDWPPNMLETEEVKGILNQIAEAGTIWLLFTGGEIFMRKDFFPIYEHALRRGFKITLFSNGTLVTKRVADRLAELPPYNIEVTLYGRSRETYEAVTGVAGSHAKCYQGVERLIERGLPLRLKTVVMKTNRHEFMDMYHFAESRGVPFKWDTMINPHFNGSLAPCNVRLSPQEAVEMDFALPFRYREYRDLYEPRKSVRDNRVFRCGSGSRTFHVDPYGNMKMCLLLREPEFSLRESSFREIWEEKFPPVYDRVHSEDHPCSSCDFTSLCGKCPGWSQLEEGRMDALVGYLCEVGHRRAKELGYYEGPVDRYSRLTRDKKKEVLLPVV